MPYHGNPTLIQRFQTWVWKILGLTEVFRQFEDEFIYVYREIGDEYDRPDWADYAALERDLGNLEDDVYQLADDVADVVLRDFDPYFGTFGSEGYDPASTEPVSLLPDPTFQQALGMAAEEVLPGAISKDPMWDCE